MTAKVEVLQSQELTHRFCCGVSELAGGPVEHWADQRERYAPQHQHTPRPVSFHSNIECQGAVSDDIIDAHRYTAQDKRRSKSCMALPMVGTRQSTLYATTETTQSDSSKEEDEIDQIIAALSRWKRAKIARQAIREHSLIAKRIRSKRKRTRTGFTSLVMASSPQPGAKEKCKEIPTEVEKVVNPIVWVSDFSGRSKQKEPVSIALKPHRLLNFLGLNGYKVSKDKAQIAKEAVVYLGLEIFCGQQLSKEGKEVICRLPEPHTVRDMQAFLGMTIEEVYCSRLDLKDVPLENPDWELFTDENSFMKNGEGMTGYTLTTQDKESQKVYVRRDEEKAKIEAKFMVATMREADHQPSSRHASSNNAYRPKIDYIRNGTKDHADHQPSSRHASSNNAYRPKIDYIRNGTKDHGIKETK
ncbi:hypothetical protein HGM15179_019611 [Zosterops borbonicus]|uniref:Uncharacterized protein n=1 Tax=Zosterops borbonicus TaxID=364589 RepID=A0A8K1DAA5_9PASS|nr:hypothetical protein HGM15179_019611 [Zosterops borbonicus]